jgi:Tfp pilus assembly protein PilO
MPDIREARRQLKLVAIVMGALCLVSVGILVSPIGTSSRTSGQRLSQLWTDLQAKDREVAPLNGIDKKVISAQEEIAVFYKDRLPSSYATISESLGKTATESGVKLTTGQYLTEPSDLNGLQVVTVTANITGNYVQTVKFVNSIERAKIFFIVDSVSLAGESGEVSLQIEMETYLKGA